MSQIKLPIKYKFQLDSTVECCVALASMIKDKWSICDYVAEDGYRWFILERWITTI